MKKINNHKIWTILPVLLFMMTCGLAVYAASLSTSSPFSSWKSSKIGNALTATDWDVLMDKLEGMNSTVQGLSNLDGIPNGTIMAFNLSSCPDGWSEYSIADGRILMGASSNIGDVGGNENNNKMHLTRGQLPDHSHVYKDTVYSEKLDSLGNNGQDKYLNYRQTGEFGTGGDFKIVGSRSSDRDNYPIYGFIKTNSQICDTTKPGVFLKFGEGRNGRGYDDGCDYALGYPDPVDIANAYVKVLYCVKQGGNTTHTLQPSINVKNNSSTYIDKFTLVINGTTFNINDHRLAAGSQGTVYFNGSDNPSIEPGTYSTIKVFGDGKECNLENGGNKNLVDELGWVGGESSHGMGYYWICS